MADGKRIAAEEEEMLAKVEVPERVSLREELVDTLAPYKGLVVVNDDPFDKFRGQTWQRKVLLALYSVFPIIEWASHYDIKYLFGDIVAGLTIASLAVPQDLGYAGLAKVPPINGLYSSFVPPLVYAVLGTSRHIAIGPTAVVSLLVGSLCIDYYNPDTQPTQYLQFVFTVTFFSGIVQGGLGILRLGFIIDFLSHACIVGLMAGAAITIALQQLKGLLGYTSFTNSTDIISVLSYVFSNTNQFNWRAFVLGFSFLIFLFTIKFLSWRFKKVPVWGKVLFYLNAMGPLISVVVSTFCVWITKANGPPANIPCVKKMPSGVSHLSSVNQLMLSSSDVGNAAAVGVVVGFISLAEAIAIARTFAAVKGYHIDGNKEMIAYGAMNIAGCLTSGYATTGSFSRSAVNYNAGGETMLTNIVMSLVVLVTLVAITPVFQYLASSVLSAIIINAVLGLIDFQAIWQVWKTDKIDILVLAGTFLGVVFASIEFGLLTGVAISMIKVLVLVTRPQISTLGQVPGTTVFRNVRQYRYAEQTDGILALRIDAPVYFTNANYIREKVLLMAESYSKHNDTQLTHVILDFTPVPDVDTTGIHSLEELFRLLQSQNIDMGISNPNRSVVRKLMSSGFVDEIGQDLLFLSVNEATKTFKSLRDSKG